LIASVHDAPAFVRSCTLPYCEAATLTAMAGVTLGDAVGAFSVAVGLTAPDRGG